MFAGSVPRLGLVLGDELAQPPRVEVTDAGRDGRADIVLFEVERSAAKRVLDLDMAEDVFVEMGRTLHAEGDVPRWIAKRIWRPERVAWVVSIGTKIAGRLRSPGTFRVIVRVLHERSLLRTNLRRELTNLIARDQ